MNEIFQKTFLENTLESYCWFVGIILFGIIFKKLFSKFLSFIVFKVLQKYAGEVGFDKLLTLLKKPLGILILLITLYVAFNRLSFPLSWDIVPKEEFGLRMIIVVLFRVSLVINITWIFLRIVDYFGLILLYRAEKTVSKTDDQLVPFFKDALKIIVVILSIFFILGAIFKLNIASLIAGLGIGGLAVALAAKETLENLIGSFTIFTDQPFIVGDLVKVGNVEGYVEKIGFRSTRIRTLEKSYVTVPNKKMVDSEVDNLSLRTQRRANFTLCIHQDANRSQIDTFIIELKNYINNHQHIVANETQIRFHDMDGGNINILVQYMVNTNDGNVYLDIRQEINFKIIENIEKMKLRLTSNNQLPAIKK